MDNSSLISQLWKEGFSIHIIEAFQNIRREEFIPKEYRDSAYLDIALPTFEGQTISQPSCIALMLDMLELDKIKTKKSKILEIGSGTGYVLALLSFILPRSKIIGIEIKRLLAQGSKERLKHNENIKVINKSGLYGHDEGAPYDRILVSASAPNIEIINQLIPQLKDGGIILSPKGFDLVKIRKTKKKVEKTVIKDAVAFVPLVG
jgi:protein-L-isoaspartate(D-aspartate) O-methyltransferase